MSGWNRSSKSILQNLALISQVGIMMLVPIFGGVLIGAFMDKYLKTSGIFLIIFVILGVGTAFRNLYMLSMQKSREYDNKETPASYVNKFETTIKKNDEDTKKDNR